MARQGNYVQGVGGNVNWAGGISDSLTGLSKSLLGQASEQAERERLAAAERENKRRYETGLVREDTRNKLLDQRYLDEQAEDARRYGIAQGRLDRQEEIERLAREKALREEQATRDILMSYSLPEERRRAFESDPALVKSINAQTEGFRTIDAEGLYVDDALARAQREGVGEDLGVSRGLTQNMVPTGQKALDYRNYLLTVDDKDLNPQALALKNKILAGDERIQKNKDAYIESTMPLYKGDAISSLTRRILGAGGALNTEATAGIERLTSPLSTRDALTSQSLAVQKAQQASADKAATALYRAAQMSQKGKSGSGGGSGSFDYIKPGMVTESEVMDVIEQIDPGAIDANRLRNQYTAAVEAGVNPAVALQALKESVADDFSVWGVRTKGPARSSEDFTNYAKGREAVNGSRNSPKTLAEWKEFLKPTEVPFVDPVAQNYEAFVRGYGNLGPDQRGLPLSYGRSRTETPRPVSATPKERYDTAGDVPSAELLAELDALEEGVPGPRGSSAAREDVLRNLERAFYALPGANGLVRPAAAAISGSTRIPVAAARAEQAVNAARNLIGRPAAAASNRVSGFVGPSKDLFWRSLDRPAAQRIGSDAKALRDWLRARAPFNGQTTGAPRSVGRPSLEEVQNWVDLRRFLPR